MAPAANAEQHVAGVDVLVAGANLDPKWRNSMIEMKVVDSLTLPDMALVRLKDPTGDAVDSHPLQLGKDLEIKVAGKGERATTSIFKGQIAAVEPEFTANGCVISVRAYGDATRWRLIAEANGVDNPLHLRRGSSLALPALEN